jgi:hypothetical protein
MKTRQFVIVFIALVVGMISSLLVARLINRNMVGATNADYYCFELRQGWTCMYALQDCEDRLALEKQENVQKKCSLHSVDAVSP